MAIKVSGTEVISDDKRILNNESLPDIRPSLLLDFANSKTLDPRITFTRGSTATYWDGKTTAKAEENLTTYSQDFSDSSWSKYQVISSFGTITAPDGTTTASSFIASTTNIYHLVYKYQTPTTADPYTFSVYLKSNGYDAQVRVAGRGAGWAFANFDLTNGTVGNTGGSNLDSTSITAVGNGWYRCSITSTLIVDPTVGGEFGIITDPTNDGENPQFAGNGTSGIYAWGFQMEQRSSATAYTATTSSPIVKYQPVLQTAASGEARFDHDPVTGESKGLLIEEARTNSLTRSEEFDHAEWSAFQSTITTDTVVAPDGTLTGTKFTPNTTSAEHYTDDVLTQATGTFTDSVFAKYGGYKHLILRPIHIGADEGGSQTVRFDLSTGTVQSSPSNVTATMEDVGNGWYRCAMSYTVTGTLSGAYAFRIQVHDDSYNSIFSGDGYSGIYIWGAQREVGSFPTSYIPTSGSTVSRAVDDAVINGDNFSSFFSANAFSIYREINMGWSMLRSPSASAVLKIDNLSSNTLTMRVVTDSSAPQLDVTLSTFGTTYADTADNNNISGYTSFKQALAIDSTSLLSHATGASGGTDTSVLLANDYSRMQLNADQDRNWVKKIAFYPKKLTLAQLSAMMEE